LKKAARKQPKYIMRRRRKTNFIMEQILLLSVITQYFFVIFLIIQNQNCGTVYANNYDNISICEMDYIHRVRLINPTGIHGDIPMGRLEVFHDGIL